MTTEEKPEEVPQEMLTIPKWIGDQLLWRLNHIIQPRMIYQGDREKELADCIDGIKKFAIDIHSVMILVGLAPTTEKQITEFLELGQIRERLVNEFREEDESETTTEPDQES